MPFRPRLESGPVWPHPADMTLPESFPDEVRRFIVEDRPVRGQWVRIESTWHALREHHHYPPAVRELLGQAVSASVLLAATLKFEGTLTFQLQGSGAVRLLVAQCTHDFRVRALARFDEQHAEVSGQDLSAGLTADLFQRLVGEDGRVIVTVEASERGAQYQGIVPLVGASLAECLETYFNTSEQLPTRVRLAANDRHAAGLLVQQLPEQGGAERSPESKSAWSETEQGIGSMDQRELLALPLEEILTRNFAQQDLRVFAGAEVRFECRCSPERVTNILSSLGEKEVREVLQEQGSITITCEFCGRPYKYDAIDVEGLFNPAPLHGSSSLQ